MKESRGISCQSDIKGSRTPDSLISLFHPQRVHLDIQVGEHANDYAEIAAKDKLSELQLRVRQLVEQVEQIQKEQNYQRVSAWRGGASCSGAAAGSARTYREDSLSNPRGLTCGRVQV